LAINRNFYRRESDIKNTFSSFPKSKNAESIFGGVDDVEKSVDFRTLSNRKDVRRFRR